MKLDRGYISPYFITNQKNKKCELDDPLISIHEKKISSLNAIVKILELALKKQRPLLIVAEDVESDALATLILNKLRVGIKVCAIKAPGFGENMKSNLQDLATLTGGQVITEELGLNMENVDIELLGSCKKVTVSKDDTVILDGSGEKKTIEERCEQQFSLTPVIANCQHIIMLLRWHMLMRSHLYKRKEFIKLVINCLMTTEACSFKRKE